MEGKRDHQPSHRAPAQGRQLVDVALTLSPIRDDAGEVIGMAGIIRDISEELEIERERVRLLEQETKARRRAEELERRASFLVEIHTALDSSLDYEVVLRRLARITVPRLADWCAIHMHGDDGSLRAARGRTQRPQAGAVRVGPGGPLPDRPGRAAGRARGAAHGQGGAVSARSPTRWSCESARDPEHLQILRELGLRSAMLVPLRARGQTLGRRDARVGRVGAPLHAGRPRLRLRDGAPRGAVDRQRAPAQRADRAQPRERVPRRGERRARRRRSTSTRPSSGSPT